MLWGRGTRVLLGLAVVLWGLACRIEPSPLRIVVLGIDGATWRAIDPLVDRGLLPTFAALKESGATGDLLALPPYNSPQMWTSIVTGQPPEVHGIENFTVRRDDGRRVPASSNLRQSPAIWNIFSERGRTVGVVGWYVTWPAEPVNGFVVSDHVRPAEESPIFWPVSADQEERLTRRTFPEELLKRARDHLLEPEDVRRPAMKADLGLFGDKHPYLNDEGYFRLGLELLREQRPDLFLTYQHGTDVMQHISYGPFEEWLQGRAEDSKHSRRVVGYYQYEDENVARLVTAMGGRVETDGPTPRISLPDDRVLVVVSDHGFAPGTRPNQPALTGDHLPEGIIAIAGARIRPGATFERTTVLDVLPTLLHLARLPVARELPGRVATEVLLDPWDEPGPRTLDAYSFTPEGGDPLPSPFDERILEELEALGYVDEEGRDIPRPDDGAMPR